MTCGYQQELIELVNALEREVDAAIAAGYDNARCVYTEEVVEIIARIRAGRFRGPVELEFTYGPFYNFSETRLEECAALQSAWYAFSGRVQDSDSCQDGSKAS